MRTVTEIIEDHIGELEDRRKRLEESSEAPPGELVLFRLIRSDCPAYADIAEHAGTSDDVVLLAFVGDDAREQIEAARAASDDAICDPPEGAAVVELLVEYGRVYTVFESGEPWADQWERMTATDQHPPR